MLRPRTIKEGSVGLFALLGLFIIGGIVLWLRGGGFGNPGYEVLVQFGDASGLQVGGAVRYRGVPVGRVAKLIPGSNGILAQLEISSTQLRIPADVQVEISRYGLLGEAAIDMIPDRQLSDAALALDPLSADCPESGKILCNGDELKGQAGTQLTNSMARLAQAYSEPQFVADINATVKSANLAAARIATMSAEITALSKTANQQVRGFGRTSEAIAKAADNASLLTSRVNQVVLTNQDHINRTIEEASLLMVNLNQLVGENRAQVNLTLKSIETTNRDLQAIGREIQTAVATVNQGLAAIDAQKVTKDLALLMENAAVTSNNIRQISADLNDPTLMLTLQQTLDAARLTFENAQKITSDVEQLTGDPAFRNNLRKLVDGLGQLVSSTENLQDQVYTAHTLERSGQQLRFQLDHQQQLASYYQQWGALNPVPVSTSPSPLAQPTKIKPSQPQENQGKP
ncbi:MlaD family protein [Synechocystis sp. PCC 7338]|uniref:MlaD family protein n=1 Tax=Synechocystis sp. PCC 7338 TaxID=2732530 RepID=UPI001BAF5A69|nr:MlaD family protein [Synechocystis sp. PCC 7338]QUS59368.1 MCE family protein [Synechocystis sp. PCC 7338]